MNQLSSPPAKWAGAIVASGLAGDPSNPALYVYITTGHTGNVSVGDAIEGKSLFTGKQVGDLLRSVEPGMTHYTLYAQGVMLDDAQHGSPGWARIDISAVAIGGRVMYTIGATVSEDQPALPMLQQSLVSGRVAVVEPKGAPVLQPGQSK